MIVDAHTHVSPRWFEPVEVLLFQLDRTGVERAALVPFTGSYDNDYLLRCAERHPDRLAALVAVDPAEPGAAAELDRLAARGAVGIRLAPPPPGAGPAAHPGTAGPAAQPGGGAAGGVGELWDAAERLGLTVSCYGSAAAFADPAFGALLRAHPRLDVVVEHLADLRRNGHYPGVAALEPVFAGLAELPRVALKFHGLGETSARAARLGDSAFADPSGAVLLAAYRVFGPDRLMWGSGFPSVSSREGYANALRHPRDLLRAAGMTAAQEQRMFGANAAAAFSSAR